jgi:hypothetical protein
VHFELMHVVVAAWLWLFRGCLVAVWWDDRVWRFARFKRRKLSKGI